MRIMFLECNHFQIKSKNSIITLGVMSSMFLVNGKTGSRDIPLIQSISYIKEWLSNHPSRNNLKSPLFVSLDNWANRRFSYRYLSLYTTYGLILKKLHYGCFSSLQFCVLCQWLQKIYIMCNDIA
jgi:hypothetical protein